MWYSATLLFLSKSTPPLKDELWEERVLLVEADSEELTVQHAQLLGKNREHHYIALEGNKINWEFKEVANIFLIEDDELRDGVELSCRYLSGTSVAAIRADLSP